MNKKLSPREHARLARELIEACGGLEEAASACRVKKSALSGYQTAHDPSTMPADIIDALEEYAQQGPIYSGAIAERRMFPVPAGNLADLACELSEQTLEAQALIRRALSDGQLTPREIDAIAAAERDAEAALDRLKAARRAIDAASPSPLRAA
ncbi:hypothetical protein [Brevundimonas viscosa]|uniref:Uncharacterized protein n=1 Tax=Brevundimonas viscosa TaxID=871741 RepID=A0A1I6PR16_9CAUL|nr:hypothetical protein [Brevundimonas viscosa]SFS42647.1 hypothetical protein SAMN05192570_1202 [Brevundimonas viscosa]